MKIKKIGFVIGGIVSCAIGFDIWNKNGGALYSQPVPKISGIVLIVFGISMIVAEIFRQRN